MAEREATRPTPEDPPVTDEREPERLEWGVRWHGADVQMEYAPTAAADIEAYDEGSARATAERYANAEAVFRRAASAWIAAPGPEGPL